MRCILAADSIRASRALQQFPDGFFRILADDWDWLRGGDVVSVSPLPLLVRRRRSTGRLRRLSDQVVSVWRCFANNSSKRFRQ